MLESVYLTLIVMSFLCLIMSVTIGNKESSKLISKILLSGIAMALFSVLAISSVDVNITYCNAISCDIQPIFQGEFGYIFWSLGLISGFIMFAYTIILILDIYKHGTFKEGYNPNLM